MDVHVKIYEKTTGKKERRVQHSPRWFVLTSTLVIADRADRLVICNVGGYPAVVVGRSTQVAVVSSHCQDFCSNKSMYSSWTAKLSALQVSIDSPWHCVCIAWSPNASQSHDTLCRSCLTTEGILSLPLQCRLFSTYACLRVCILLLGWRISSICSIAATYISS
jgi:hypothetical protein